MDAEITPYILDMYLLVHQGKAKLAYRFKTLMFIKAIVKNR